MSEVTTYNDESAVSIAIRGYGHIEGLITLSKENNMPVDSDEVAAAVRKVNDAIKEQLKQSPPLFSITPTPRMKPVIINSGQNLVDLALQETGGIDGIYSLVTLNGFSYDDDPVAGNELEVHGVTVVDNDVRSAYKSVDYRVNTSTNDDFIIPDGVRLLEDGDYRLVEDGPYRIIE